MRSTSIYRQKGSKNWWIKYYRNGRSSRESSGSPKKSDATRLLRLKEGDIERGLHVTPKIGRVTFDEAAADVISDYRTNGKRSLNVVERRIKKHLEPFFGGRRMANITTSDVRAYVAKRQEDMITVRKARHEKQADGSWAEIPALTRPVSNAEINRELTILKRAFSLAIQADKLYRKPHIPLLKEDNVRRGFFDDEQVAAVIKHLAEPLDDVVWFAYITGWRIPSEVLTLEWRQVDFHAGQVRLDPGTTKNNEGRVFQMTAELRELLQTRKDAVEDLRRTRRLIVPQVFYRMVADCRGGERFPRKVTAFNKAWKTACTKAGLPGRIPHDLRRSAVRNLVRAGVPERVAMQMTGHKTRSVFERYNIVSESDLIAAAKRLDERRGHSLGIVRAVGAGDTEPVARFAEEKLEAPPGFEPGIEVLQTSLGSLSC